MIKQFIKKQIRKTGLVRALEMDNKKLQTQNKKLQTQINNLKKEMLKLNTVPNFGGLKHTLKGKEGYLFLINDSNNEIRQHFDQSYINQFNRNLFIERLKHNEEYCKNKNIKYNFFIIPDKSYICWDLLPFDIKTIKRNYDLIKHSVPDFSENLDNNCYFNTDSHINFLGGKELSYKILNYIENSFSREEFNNLIEKQMITGSTNWTSDLLSLDNWSYSDEERLEYIDEDTIFFINKDHVDLKDKIPEKFKSHSTKSYSTRETEYYLNKNSLTNLKVLILRDSATNLLKDVLMGYFKEMLLYWDHWYFNKKLIEWYKPDIILEIRTERFLEGMERKL